MSDEQRLLIILKGILRRGQRFDKANEGHFYAQAYGSFQGNLCLVIEEIEGGKSLAEIVGRFAIEDRNKCKSEEKGEFRLVG